MGALHVSVCFSLKKKKERKIEHTKWEGLKQTGDIILPKPVYLYGKVMTPRSAAAVQGDRWSRWPGTWESSHLSGMEVFLSVTSVVVIFKYHLCKWKKRDDQGSSPYFPDAYNSWGSAKVNGRSPALNPSLLHRWQEPNYLSHHSLPLRCPLAGNWNWNWSQNSIPGTEAWMQVFPSQHLNCLPQKWGWIAWLTKLSDSFLMKFS